MNSVSLTGSDTIQIDSRTLNDIAEGDSVMITFPNDLANLKTGKNGNTIYAFNEMGRVVECSMRVLLGSSDDQYLTGRMQEQKNGFSDFILLTGAFTKRTGDGQGNIASVVYQLSGGIFKKQTEAKTSAEGDTDQSVAVYTISFGNGSKSIQ